LLIGISQFAGYSQESIFSSSEVYKLSVDQPGIYKIDGNFINSSLAFDINSIDPSKIQVFTDNGGALTERFGEYFSDPAEIPIYVQDGGDGRFDPSDAIYFYSFGPDNIRLTQTPEITKNIYSEQQYVFIKFNDNNGKRISSKSSLEDTPAFSYQTTTRIHRHEVDKQNLLGEYASGQGSGQSWYGESFTNNWEQNFSSFFDNVAPIPNTESLMKFRFAARSDQASSVQISINNILFDKSINRADLGEVESTYAYVALIEEPLNIGNSPSVNIIYEGNSNTDEAWLDYIQITTEENINYQIGEFIFHIGSAEEDISQISLASMPNGFELWDVSDVRTIYKADLENDQFVYRNNGNINLFTFFNPSGNYGLPNYVGKLESQNVKNLGEPEFIIIYHKDFADATIRLKDHRSMHDPLVTAAVDVEEIYNEFSSGRKDITAIRNFVRYHYEQSDNFRYLLLMGDASYDNRQLRGLPDEDFIPVFQTQESLDPVRAFPSDDYYGITDQDISSSLDGEITVAVGRIPAKTAQEATDVVNKIIRYETDVAFLKDWKLDIGFAADDEDSNLHVNDTDEIAELTIDSFSIFNQKKVYFDSFQQESTPGGPRYPDANKKLVENLLKGQLVLTYLGHGGPKGWAQERVFQIDDIATLDNTDKLPLIVTATCSFTGFDDPNFVTAGENAILNPDGGAIALFTTVRSVFASRNAQLTEAVLDILFQKREGKYRRLGDVLKVSKNNNINNSELLINSRKFALIGDPTVRLAAPKQNISLNSINGRPIDNNRIDTIKALDLVNMGGYIHDDAGNKLTSFNGKVFLTFFDKATQATTIANDSRSSVKSFNVQNNILFKGSATVSNGDWQIDFVIPKEIDFRFGEGRLSMYASDEIDEDAGGFYTDVIIGGSSENSITDDVGPVIEIFMNDESFASGGITNTSPNLFIKLEDQLGINISSNSIGHDIVAILDDDNNNPIKLNDFYQATTDDYRTGTVNYPLRNLEPGLHKIKIKAWDICNNSSERELTFNVIDIQDNKIDHVYNYPNPFTSNTNFTFEHTFAGSMIDIGIGIYTLSGKLVKNIEKTIMSNGFRINDVAWDGRDDYGERLGIGTYLYKVKIKDTATELDLESDFQKLVILK